MTAYRLSCGHSIRTATTQFGIITAVLSETPTLLSANAEMLAQIEIVTPESLVIHSFTH